MEMVYGANCFLAAVLRLHPLEGNVACSCRVHRFLTPIAVGMELGGGLASGRRLQSPLGGLGAQWRVLRPTSLHWTTVPGTK